MTEYMPRAYVRSLPVWLEWFWVPLIMLSLSLAVFYFAIESAADGHYISSVILSLAGAAVVFGLYGNREETINGFSRWRSSRSGRMWLFYMSSFVAALIAGATASAVFTEYVAAGGTMWAAASFLVWIAAAVAVYFPMQSVSGYNV